MIKLQEVCSYNPTAPWPWIALLDVTFKSNVELTMDKLTTQPLAVIESKLLNNYILHVQQRLTSKAHFSDVVSLINYACLYSELDFYYHFRARLANDGSDITEEEFRVLSSDKSVGIELLRSYTVSQILEGNIETPNQSKAQLFIDFFDEYSDYNQLFSSNNIFPNILSSIHIVGENALHYLDKIVTSTIWSHELHDRILFSGKWCIAIY